MCKIIQTTNNDNINDNNIDIRKDSSKSMIGEANELLKKHSHQDNLWCYELIMLLSFCAFVFLFVSTAKGKLFEVKDNQQLIYISFCLIVESLLFVWWMKFLGKLLADARESMKAWRTKVTDACGLLIDMETSLYKAVVDKQKKALEKDDTQTSQNNDTKSIDENAVRNIVDNEIGDIIKESIAEQATIEWNISLKNKN